MNSIELIKRFCDTLDTKYLGKLPKEYQVFFQKTAESIKQRRGALKVLRFFDLNDDGSRKFTGDGNINKAEQELFRMSVGSTGARKGDILLGTHKGTNGAILQVHNNIFSIYGYFKSHETVS